MTFRCQQKMAESHLLATTILYLLLVYSCESKNVPKGCGHYSIKVKKDDTFMCFPCAICSVGFGPSIQCGSFTRVLDPNMLKCRVCSKGTFSDTVSHVSCKPCRSCGDRFTVKRNCTPTEDTECIPRRSNCKKGFYYSEKISSCLPCSRCCEDGKDEKIEECTKQGGHNGKFCSVFSFHRCHQTTNYILRKEKVTEKSLNKRIPFSVLKTTSRTTVSTVGFLNISIYNHTSGIYNRTTIENVLAENRSYISLKLLTSFTCGISILLLAIFILLAFKAVGKRYSKNHFRRKCFPLMRLPYQKSKQNAHMSKGDQSDELEDWSNNDITSGIYSFKCGVIIQYDQNCIEDKSKNLVVETLNYEDIKLKPIKPGCIALSPVYRFYSKGEKFKNAVKVSMPHSALWTSDKKTWDIHLLCMDERKGEKEEWEILEDSVKINWKDASFHCDTLLTFVVVGRPLTGAKKRMQFVVFAQDEMISDLFEVVLYLLDDNETSFERILKENECKGFSMFGSFYAAFVDVFSSVDITIDVKNLVAGWEVDSDRSSPTKTICRTDCVDSYFKIPRLKTVFRRINRRAEEFNCRFSIDIAGSETIIPVFAFLPEEVELCVKVDIDDDKDHLPVKENTSLFKDLPLDAKHEMSLLLDAFAGGQGSWHKVGRYFGLDESVEWLQIANLERSPTYDLFEFLVVTQPKLTVREFSKCLESLGCEDVLSVLYKVNS